MTLVRQGGPHGLAAPAKVDAVTFLTIYLLLVCAVPSYLTIPALGSVGRLSVLWGLVGIAWWAYFRLQSTQPLGRGSWLIKASAAFFFCSVALTYAWINLRGAPSNYATTADSSLIRLASWAGIVLVAMDGIPNRERLLVLLRRLVLAGGLMSALGLVQFVTGLSLVDSISLPGFTASSSFDGIQDRGGFLRSAGTASHPLEYGSVLCMSLPLGIVLATCERHRTLLARWTPVLTIALAAMLSMSRSALIGILIGLLLATPSIPPRYRVRAAATGAVLMTIVVFLVPGMLGTLRGLFLGIGSDASSLSRADSFSMAIDIAMRNPVLGQGFGIFLPQELILDNQILLLLIEVGLTGLATFLFLVVVGVTVGWAISKRTDDSDFRLIAPAVSASIASGASTLIFFDGLAFPITAGLLFLLLGITGGMARVLGTESSQPGLERTVGR